MRNELLDILSGKTTPITNEQLIRYLTGELNDGEKHEVEKALLNSGIDDEALEGLKLVQHKDKLHLYDHELQKALREKLHQKKSKRTERKTISLNYLLILTGALLALIILVWLLYHLAESGQ